MNNQSFQQVIKAETEALESLDGVDVTETTFACPLCGGTAHLTLHEWLGYESHCENGCFNT